MPPPTPNPADLLSDLPKTTLVLSHFANLKLTGDRLVRETITTLRPSTPPPTPPGHHARPSRRRRRRVHRSTRVHTMSDADLEAELAARRTARARERERYAKALRSEKLTVLESELTRLRSELARMDRAGGLGAGTPPTVRWEALPNRRRSTQNIVPGTPVPRHAPPPPPPMPRNDTEEVMDPEKRRREKEERQRRREAKRREREANRKPLTLADIIKSAGPDPMKRLKPSGSIPVPDIHEPQDSVGEDLQGAKEGLKKVVREEKNRDGKDGEQEADDYAKGEEIEEREGKRGKKIEEEGEDEAKDDTKEGGTNGNAKTEKVEETNTNEAKATAEPENKIESSDSSTDTTPKPEEKKSPTKITNTATEDITTAPTPPQQNKNGDTAEANVVTEVTKDEMTNGTPNGVDALAALVALKEKLPSAASAGSAHANENGDTGRKGRRRVSLEEKRRLRRAKDGGGEGDVKEKDL